MASRSHDKSYLNRRYLLEKDFSWKDLKKNHLESSITSSDEGSFEEHSLDSLYTADKNDNSRYKTELCRSFEETGKCKYTNKCQFAHGPDELRSLDRHPRYKTELCRRFHETGFCSYGTRCHFLHDSNEQHLIYNRKKSIEKDTREIKESSTIDPVLLIRLSNLKSLLPFLTTTTVTCLTDPNVPIPPLETEKCSIQSSYQQSFHQQPQQITKTNRLFKRLSLM